MTLSSKYQVVIPRSVRIRLGLKPGMKLQVIEYNGRVEFMPVRKAAELRGLLRGLEPVLEYLVDSERASMFAELIGRTQRLIVPVIVIYELFKKVLRERGEQQALEVYGKRLNVPETREPCSVKSIRSFVHCSRRDLIGTRKRKSA